MPRPNPFTTEQEADIIRLYASGVSTHSIANAMNTFRSNIQRRLRAAGVIMRTANERRPGLPIRHDAFSSTPLEPEAAYWIGFLMADGYVSDPKKYGTRYVSLTVSNRDRMHLELFRRFLGSGHKVLYKKARFHHGVYTKATVTLTFSSSQIATDLGRYGITPRKSHTAKASIDLIDNRDFWRGVVDGDGSLGLYLRRECSKARPLIQLAGSRFIVSQFAEFASTFGATATPCIGRGLWRIGIWCAPAVRLIHHLYADACQALDRKQAIAQKIMAINRPVAQC